MSKRRVRVAVAMLAFTGCAVIGACCAPLAFAAGAGAAHPKSAATSQDSSFISPTLESHVRTLTLTVEGLPRRGDFL
ncbi:MAG: hypothetical protein IT347_04240 [Candidatus Eisenbacteria bacterium]|jgi:hypothetical protein|nr:hypothetical protein [Candidatus Eisenbacteria bacterium]